MTTLRMVRGDGRTFTITIADSDGVAVDISTSTLAFTARRAYDGVAVIEKTTGSGITATATTGEATLAINPEDTSGLPDVVTDLVWDVHVVDGSGNPQTPLGGILRIDPDVTYSEGS